MERIGHFYTKMITNQDGIASVIIYHDWLGDHEPIMQVDTNICILDSGWDSVPAGTELEMLRHFVGFKCSCEEHYQNTEQRIPCVKAGSPYEDTTEAMYEREEL